MSVAIAALCACQKEMQDPAKEVRQNPGEGIPMTIKATIAENTKAIAADDGTAIKFSWEATEKVSIVALAADNSILSVDTFTSTGAAGRADAEFTGSVTGGSFAKLVCYYPALDVVEGNLHSYKIGSNPYFSIDTSSPQLNLLATSFAIPANASLEAISKGALMSGDIDTSSGTPVVSMGHRLNFIKLSIDLSETGLTSVDAISIIDEEKAFVLAGRTLVNPIETVAGLIDNFVDGNKSNTYSINANGIAPEAGIATIYVPMYFNGAAAAAKQAGDKWLFEITGRNASDVTNTFVTQKSFKSDFSFQAGHCTPITLAKAGIAAKASITSIVATSPEAGKIKVTATYPTNSGISYIDYSLWGPATFRDSSWWDWGEAIFQGRKYTLTEADKVAGTCEFFIDEVAAGTYCLGFDAFNVHGIKGGGNSVEGLSVAAVVAPEAPEATLTSITATSPEAGKIKVEVTFPLDSGIEYLDYSLWGPAVYAGWWDWGTAIFEGRKYYPTPEEKAAGGFTFYIDEVATGTYCLGFDAFNADGEMGQGRIVEGLKVEGGNPDEASLSYLDNWSGTSGVIHIACGWDAKFNDRITRVEYIIKQGAMVIESGDMPVIHTDYAEYWCVTLVKGQTYSVTCTPYVGDVRGISRTNTMTCIP